MVLTEILDTPYAQKIEHVIERKAQSPSLRMLHKPKNALNYIQTTVCVSYLFGRFFVPSYASMVFGAITEMHPTTDKLGTILKGVTEMVEGELFNNNIFEREGEAHSHFYDTVESFHAAGGDSSLVPSFLRLEESHGIEYAIQNSPLWGRWTQNFADSFLMCYDDPLTSFIFMPTMEELSPQTSVAALKNLSDEPRFDHFRTFLSKHVELDEDEHGPIAQDWLRTYIAHKGSSSDEQHQAAANVHYMLTGTY